MSDSIKVSSTDKPEDSVTSPTSTTTAVEVTSIGPPQSLSRKIVVDHFDKLLVISIFSFTLGLYTYNLSHVNDVEAAKFFTHMLDILLGVFSTLMTGGLLNALKGK